MTKPTTNDLCSQRTLQSGWASAKNPRFLHANSEACDQTGRMPRLIRVFTGRTDHCVRFVMLSLNFKYWHFIRPAAYFISILDANRYFMRISCMLVDVLKLIVNIVSILPKMYIICQQYLNLHVCLRILQFMYIIFILVCILH